MSDELRDGELETESFHRRNTRCWKESGDDSPMVCYLAMRGRVTFRQIVDHFAEHYPNVDPWTLQLNYCTATWEEPPTADDVAQRQASRKWSEERKAAWEEKTYRELKAKFEGAANAADAADGAR